MNQQSRNKIHVKVGDTIKIISGRQKGEIGQVVQVINKTSKVIIKNINFRTKHVRPKQNNTLGQILKIESPIHSSNVMLYSTKQQTSSRYRTIINNKSKTRILIKTNETVNNNKDA